MPIGDRNDAREAAQLIQLLGADDPRRAQLLERITAWDNQEHSNVPPGLRSGNTRTGSPGQPAGVMQQPPRNDFEQFGAGVLRTLDHWGNGIKQMWNKGMQPAPAYQTADPQEADRLAGPQGLELQGELYARQGERQDKLYDIAANEQVARDLYDRIDSEKGLFGTTIGLEDLGELTPDLIAFLGTGGGSTAGQMMRLGTRAALVGALGATTEGESRLQNTLLAGAFGVAFPGMLRAGDSILRNAAFYTRFALGAAGSVAGIRGLGRASTVLAKIGGEARRLQVNQGDAARLTQIMTEAAERLAPTIQGLSRQQVKDVQRQSFRDLLASNYKANIHYMSGTTKPGLDVPGFIRELEGLAAPTIRTRFGKVYGESINEFVEFGRTVAPEIDNILRRGILPDRGVRGVLNAITDYMGSGSFRAIQSLKNPTERRLQHLKWLQRVTASMGAGTAAKEDTE